MSTPRPTLDPEHTSLRTRFQMADREATSCNVGCTSRSGCTPEARTQPISILNVAQSRTSIKFVRVTFPSTLDESSIQNIGNPVIPSRTLTLWWLNAHTTDTYQLQPQADHGACLFMCPGRSLAFPPRSQPTNRFLTVAMQACARWILTGSNSLHLSKIVLLHRAHMYSSEGHTLP